MKRSLRQIVERCKSRNSVEDCPLVHKATPKTTR
jgi:hypothetical protein